MRPFSAQKWFKILAASSLILSIALVLDHYADSPFRFTFSVASLLLMLIVAEWHHNPNGLLHYGYIQLQLNALDLVQLTEQLNLDYDNLLQDMKVSKMVSTSRFPFNATLSLSINHLPDKHICTIEIALAPSMLFGALFDFGFHQEYLELYLETRSVELFDVAPV